MSQAPTRHLVDQSTWKRKTQYDFFRDFAEPFWGLTVDVDCTKAYRYSKAKGYFFYHYYLHCSTAAAILVENFRYRIDEGQVYLYDSIDLAATVARPDETFGFSFIPYDPDFDTFTAAARTIMQDVQTRSDIDPATPGSNVIHYSAIPWLAFTSLSHARQFDRQDSCPKITFGKAYSTDGRMMMPVSIHVHHALVDAIHVGQYVKNFQAILNVL